MSSGEDDKIKRKIVVIGDGACGKTCLLQTFREGRFPIDSHYIPTVFSECIVDMDYGTPPREISLELWDTAGQEDFDRLRLMSYPDADIVFICFSVDSPDSLLNVLDKWLPEVRENTPIYTKRMLVGLKTDLRTDQETIDYLERIYNRMPLTYDEGKRVASKLHMEYVECSAKLNRNVRHVFETALDLVVTDQDLKHPRGRRNKANANDSTATCSSCVVL